MKKEDEEQTGSRHAFKTGVWIGAAGLVILAGLGAVVGVVSGIVPIKASSGHWPITHWILNFAKERSVATHSMGIKTPALEDHDLILKGAVHYDIGCRSCHGSPGLRQPRIPAAMTPNPPYLPPDISEWDPAELFYIVKYGIKFTGMPAWPAQQREDEIWAVVAFLQKLPELDQNGYRQLVESGSLPSAPIEDLGLAPATTRALVQSCARCHGHDGIARGTGAFPNLAGQRRAYVQNALEAYARGERHSGIMQPIAAGLDDAVIRDLATYYATLEPPRQPQADEPEAPLMARGRFIAQRGIPKDRVPACMECHDPAGRRAKDAYPALAGQPADYLVLQLELFKKRHRGGSDYAHLMHHVVDHLSAEDMRAAALYFESLSAAEP